MNRRLGPWTFALVAILVWLVLQFVPLPGVDGEALAFAMKDAPWTTVGGFSLVGLVAWRAIADALTLDPARGRIARAGFLVVYLLGIGGAAWTYAVGLEGITWAPAVPEPGVRFQLVLVLTAVAAAAVAWFAADRLDAVGLDGAWLLVVPEVAVHVWTWHADLLALRDLGTFSVTPVLASPLLPLAAVALLLALRPPKWPVPVVHALESRSPVSLLLVPYVIGALVPEGGQTLGEGLVGLFLDTLLSWAGVVGVAVLLWTRPAGAGGWRRVVHGGMAVAAVLVPLGMVGVWAVDLALTSPRFAGSSDVEVRVTYEGDVSERDLQRLERRMAGIGTGGQIVREGTSAVRVTLLGVDAAQALPWLADAGTRGGRFTVHPVARVRTAEIRSLLADVADPQDPSTWPPPPRGLLWGPEPCRDLRVCRVHLLEPAFFDAHQIEGASAGLDPRMGMAGVDLQFTSEGRERFGEWTAAHVGDQMALVLDGAVMSAPVVREPIRGGRATLTVAREDTPEETLAAASDLADAVTSGGLDAGRRVSFEVVHPQ